MEPYNGRQGIIAMFQIPYSPWLMGKQYTGCYMAAESSVSSHQKDDDEHRPPLSTGSVDAVQPYRGMPVRATAHLAYSTFSPTLQLRRLVACIC